jgi:MFS transporter, DHA1 family, multidrug resistance protein
MQLHSNKARLNIFIIILLAFSQQIGLAIITPSLLQMSKYISVSIFGVMGLYMIGMGVGQVFWGTWSDSVGRKALLSIGVFIFALTSLLITFTDNSSLILLLRFIQGFSTGSMYSISQAIIADQSKSKEKMIRSIAISDFGFGFAWIILPFIGGFVAQTGNWKNNFYIMSCFVFTVALVCLMSITETRERKYLHNRNFIKSIKFFLSMYKNPYYVFIPLLIAIPNTFFTIFNTNAPTILSNNFHVSPVLIGCFSSSLGIAYTIAIFFNLNFLNKKRSTKVISSMTILFFITAIIQFIFAVFNILNFYTLYVPMIFNVVIWGIMFPHILAHALSVYKNDGGTVGSNLGFTFFIISGAATFFFGIFFKHNFLSIAQFTFIASFITVILVIFFNIVLYRKQLYENL